VWTLALRDGEPGHAMSGEPGGSPVQERHAGGGLLVGQVFGQVFGVSQAGVVVVQGSVQVGVSRAASAVLVGPAVAAGTRSATCSVTASTPGRAYRSNDRTGTGRPHRPEVPSAIDDPGLPPELAELAAARAPFPRPPRLGENARAAGASTLGGKAGQPLLE
jgi:hypothetical protein